MGLTVKQNRRTDDSVKGNPLPVEILPPLPDDVLERFPELEEWVEAANKNWRDAVEALERRANTNAG
jgi:hypothetical protein